MLTNQHNAAGAVHRLATGSHRETLRILGGILDACEYETLEAAVRKYAARCGGDAIDCQIATAQAWLAIRTARVQR